MSRFCHGFAFSLVQLLSVSPLCLPFTETVSCTKMAHKWRKNTPGAGSPKKKGCGPDMPMLGDGKGRKSGPFYEWRARPIKAAMETIEVEHAVCDALVNTVYEDFQFRP